MVAPAGTVPSAATSSKFPPGMRRRSWYCSAGAGAFLVFGAAALRSPPVSIATADVATGPAWALTMTVSAEAPTSSFKLTGSGVPSAGAAPVKVALRKPGADALTW